MHPNSTQGGSNASSFPTSALLACIAAKSIMNSTCRFLFPFVVFFATDMGVSITLFSSTVLIAAEISSVFAPFMGYFFSRHQTPHVVISLCTFVSSIACLLNGLFPPKLSFGLLFAVFSLRLLFGAFYNLINSSVQACVASHVPPTEHGRLTGLVESSWTIGGFSFIVHGAVLRTFGWRGPFVVNGALLMLITPIMFCYIPRTNNKNEERGDSRSGETDKSRPFPPVEEEQCDEKQSIFSILKSSKSLVLLSFLVWNNGGFYLVFASYSIWLNTVHNLSSTTTGIVTLALCFGELAACSLMTFFSDRIGLLLNLQLCGLVLVFATFLLSFLTTSATPLSLAMLAVALIFVLFEWGIILSIGYASRLFPTRFCSPFLATVFCFMALARSLGALVSDHVYTRGGFRAVCFAAAAMELFGVILLYSFTKHFGNRIDWKERKAVVVDDAPTMHTTQL